MMKKMLWSSVAMTVGMGMAGCATSGTDGQADVESALSTPDTTHTGVGALVFPRPDNGEMWNLCSGALISPTVFLTAGHCTEDAKWYAEAGVPIGVTFDQVVSNSSTVIAATQIITAPDFKPPHYNLNDDMHDIGVLILAEPVTDRPIYSLAAPGALKPGTVRPGAPITAVGYGVDQVGESGGPGYANVNDKTRDYGTLKFIAASTAWLTANQKSADGVCFGDSGGPSFMTLNGTERIVGVNSIINGYDCNEVTWSYRTDGDSTRAFLGQYVTLP
jgi:secreted trypsin-like serine protease